MILSALSSLVLNFELIFNQLLKQLLQNKQLLFEVCANGIQSAINAQEAGADRIELCENLEVGGVTPRIEIIQEAKEKISIPMHVLIRPRAGDFFYSEKEYELMLAGIQTCKRLNVDGIVTGMLNPDLSIDKDRCNELINLAHPLPVTFHRAFDVVRDPFQALEELIALRFDRILTSGQQEDAGKGAPLISRLVNQARNRISILAGGGITEENIVLIIQQSGANEFHFSAKTKSADGSYVSDPVRIKNICDLAQAAYQSLNY